MSSPADRPGELREALARVEGKLDAATRKDPWDKARIVGGLMVPVAIAATGYYYSDVQADAAATREHSIVVAQTEAQAAIARVSQELEATRTKVEQGRLVADVARQLRSPAPAERLLALHILRFVEPALAEGVADLLAEEYPELASSLRGTEALPRPLGVTESVQLFGGWPRVRGDGDMDTDGSDVVPVSVRSHLRVEGDRVLADISFSIEEDGGDQTAFRGTRTVPVYVAKPGTRIRGIIAAGGPDAHFTADPRGRNHGLLSLQTQGTYWHQLQYRIDSRGRDEESVGVAGIVGFTVLVAAE